MKTRLLYFSATWALLLWAIIDGPRWALYVGLGLNCAGVIVCAMAGHRAMLKRLHVAHPQPPARRPLQGWQPNDGPHGPLRPPLGHSAVPPLHRHEGP